MAIQTLNTIKQWFKTGLKPTQTQFWDTWDSFRHKYDKVPTKDVEGLDDLLLSKADKTALNDHLADKSAHAQQVNTDWNSESGFSQLINKPEFKTINGKSVIGDGDIVIEEGGSQNLQTTLDNGNETTNGMTFNDDYYNWLKTSIDSRSIRLTDSNSDMLVAIDSAGVVIREDNQQVSLNPQGIFFNRDTAESYLRINTSSTGVSTVNLPVTEGTEITLASTKDFKTINGESIIGEGDVIIDVPLPGLKSVLDKDPTASYGESSATIMGNNNDNSKYNDFTVSDETDKTVILQLKNQLSFDHTLLNSNDISNITLSEGNIKLIREKSNNQTVVDMSDPIANTQLRFPAKSEEGKEYTIATTDDFKTINGESIVGEGDITVSGGSQTLDQVLAAGSIAYDKNLVLSSKGAYAGLSFGSYNSSVNPNLTTTASLTMLNSNEDLSPKGGAILSVHPESTGMAKFTFKEYKGDRDFVLATTEDFKTINGQSIVGEGDISIGGGGSQNLQQTLENGGNVRESDTPLSIRMDNYGNTERPFDASTDIRPGVIGVSKLNKNDFHINGSAYVDVEFDHAKQDGYGLLNLSRQGADLSFVTSRLIASKSPSGLEASFYLPSTNSSYLSQTLAVSVNGVKANDYGEIVIPTGGSQNIDQVLATGFIANDKNILLRSSNDHSDSIAVQSMSDSGAQSSITPLGFKYIETNDNGTGTDFYEYSKDIKTWYYDSALGEPITQHFKFPRKGVVNEKDYTLATTDDFKTINGESVLGTGDITIGETTTDATTTVKGIVKLTGDLGGTADNPTTPTAVHKTGYDSIKGLKEVVSSASASAQFTFVTGTDATNRVLEVRTQSGTREAIRIGSEANNGTAALITTFGSNATGLKIEPDQNNPSNGKMLVLSNKKAGNGGVDTAMPLTILRDGATVASISDLGVINTSGANFTGKVNISNLSGVGTRIVVADVSGNLSATDIAPTSGTFIPTTGGAYVTFARSYWTLVGKVLTVHLNGSVTGVTGVAFNVILPNSFTINSPIVNRRIGAGIVQLPSASLTLGNMYFREDTINTIVGVEIITPNNNTYNFSGSFLVLIN